MNHLKVVGCAALLSGLALIGQAAGADNALPKAPLMACPSDKTVIGGVNACGKIWKIGSGEVALNADGKLIVDIRGLVLNDPSVGKYDGSPDGVDAVAAAVVCRGKSQSVWSFCASCSLLPARSRCLLTQAIRTSLMHPRQKRRPMLSGDAWRC
jgi:hypothetical protein